MDLSRLNDAQRKSVLHGDSPLLMLAGAGTGKTTAITYRVAHLMHERGVRPDKILALTFTNKAAREMRERSAQIAQVDARWLAMGTFHSMCGRLLREFGHLMGLDRQFVIYDQADQLQMVKQCLAELNLDAQVYAPRAIRHRIEQWKNQGQRPEDVEPSQFDMVERKALDIYKLYRKRCIASNAVDFGDMLLHVVSLLRRHELVRDACHNRWSHILVDEYQDTNPVQYQLLRALVTENHSITVVGDDDQSIYRWRGADIGNILRFEQDFPGAEVIRLERNYRSTQVILEAANALISYNAARKGKTLYTDEGRGDLITLRVYPNERDEAEAIAEHIDRESDAFEVEDGEFGVLYRTNAQSRPIEDALRRRSIGYEIYGGVRFYDRKEVKDALAYVRLLVNPRSDVDYQRIINVPARGIGKTSVEKIRTLAVQHDLTMFEATQKVVSGELEGPSRARNKLKAFIDAFQGVASTQDSQAPAEVVQELLEEMGYLAALQSEGTDEAQDRLANLDELISAIAEYSELVDEPSLAGFLEEVTLASDIDAMDEAPPQVSLMTLHAAKGLEFRTVFMPGMEEGIFPHSRSMDSKPELEEERRLCYVGITRAKSHLHMSSARVRTVFGDTRWSELSRFIAEVPPELMDMGVKAQPTPKAPTRSNLLDHFRDDEPSYDADFTDDSEEVDAFYPGARVSHATFGVGQVVSSDGAGQRRKLTVQFPDVGRKVIVARFVQPI